MFQHTKQQHAAAEGLRRTRVSLCGLLCVLIVAGCTDPATHPALERADLPPLLQAHRFAYPGQIVRAYQLSPDGRKLAWIGPHFMQSRLFVRDNESGDVRRFRIGSAAFQWTPDGRRVLYTADTSGAENMHVYMIDVEGDAEAVDLTPYPGAKAYIHQFVHGKPNQVLVLHNRRDRRVLDLYRIDLDTRQETLVATNPGDAVAAVTAPDGRLMGWQRSRYAQRTAEDRQKSFLARQPALRAEQGESFRVLGKNAKEGLLWALSSRGRDRVAFVAVHPTLGWEKVIFEDPLVDVTRVTFSRVTGNPIVVHSDPGYPRNEILDPTLERDLAPLLKPQSAARFGFEIVSSDAAEKRMIVLIHTSSQQRYYLVDRASGSYTLLAESLPEDVADALGEMQPVAIRSRDDLTLHGYLTVPPGVAPKALPMVLLVHGGPWMRNTWGNPLRSDDAAFAHFLANRGYAVLQVNFRGSVGYGRSFLTAGIGEFAASMQDDLHDAVHWAVENGIADRQRVAVVGWSYGGYAALLGLAMTPQVFACGVSWNGPTDLAAMIESFPPYWAIDLSMWYDYVGDPAIPEDREAMNAKSPLYHAQKIDKPVLIVQGTNDVRVRRDQAERMVQALRASSKRVEYLEVPEMGHHMGYWVHRLAVLRKTETFLHGCIGGRASRFDPFDAIAWVWTRVKG